MLKFEGQESIKQYLQSKPAKCKMKLFTIAGHILNEETTLDKMMQAVLDVSEHYLNKSQKLFFNNYYTSVEPMTELEQRKSVTL